MLEKVSYNDLPISKNSHANAKFAETCVDEFIQLKCDAVKVSGWPIRRETKALATTMKNAVKKKNMIHKIKVQADKNFVYLSLNR